jgi:hypothetical protein
MNGAKRKRRKEDEEKNPARDCAITPDAHVRSSRGRERGAGRIELRARSVELRARSIEQRAKSAELKWSSTGQPVAPSTTTPVGRNPEREPPAKAGARVEEIESHEVTAWSKILGE